MRLTAPLLLSFLMACGGSSPAPAPEAPAQKAAAITADQVTGFFKAVPATAPAAADAEKTDLGRMLFYDTRLSATQTQSCNSCHNLRTFGVDNEPTSEGAWGERGARNSPTVYYAFGHIAQFWDGRAPDTTEQAKGPILNPVEMAMPDEATVEALLRSIPGYVERFKAAFPGEDQPVTYQHMAEAIGAFEQHLTSPSPFDKWLEGDATALDAGQLEGLKAFVDTGCTACHSGPYIGGQMFQKLGVIHPVPTQDEGRKAITGNDADLHVFKVPSLRNIRETAPYFHDGSVATLPEAVKLMAYHQLGKELDDSTIQSIVAFLASLTGTPDAHYIAKPELPPNGPNTPGPLAKPTPGQPG